LWEAIMSEAESQQRANSALQKVLAPVLEELAGDPLAQRWLGGHLISAGALMLLHQVDGAHTAKLLREFAGKIEDGAFDATGAPGSPVPH
jgi:hypothetical protein